MNKFNLSLFIAMFTLFAGLHAAESFPLEIDADSSDCGTDLENCTLTGNVLIRQGDARVTTDKLFSRSETEWELSGNITIEKTGITIDAEQASIILSERQLESFSLVGAPVNFRYLVDNNSQATGKANNISFNLNSRMIILEGGAQLLESGNELNGEHIEYDVDAERLKANNQGQGDGRVHLIFEPPEKTDQQSDNDNETIQNQESEPQE
jgi:lipopolysaccharide export system protein LptA